MERTTNEWICLGLIGASLFFLGFNAGVACYQTYNDEPATGVILMPGTSTDKRIRTLEHRYDSLQHEIDLIAE